MEKLVDEWAHWGEIFGDPDVSLRGPASYLCASFLLDDLASLECSSLQYSARET
jgi:hypothetical protein